MPETSGLKLRVINVTDLVLARIQHADVGRINVLHKHPNLDSHKCSGELDPKTLPKRYINMLTVSLEC